LISPAHLFHPLITLPICHFAKTLLSIQPIHSSPLPLLHLLPAASNSTMVVPSLQIVTDGVPPSLVDTPATKSTPPVDNPPPTRRSSVRIQAIQHLEKEQLARKRTQLPNDSKEEVSTKRPPAKRSRVDCRPLVKEKNSLTRLELNDDQQAVQGQQWKKAEKECREIGGLAIQTSPELPSADGGQASGKSANAIVTDTVRMFNKYYLHFVQEEESRCGRKKEDDKQSHKSKSKSKSQSSQSKEKGASKSTSMRPDLKAITKMLNTGAIMYPKKRIGDLPGVGVGHQFYSRCEMVAIGFHGHWLNGIDYMGAALYQKEYKDYTLPIAVAIVLSGMYEDDHDNADEVTYTGQGGHNLTGDKRQIKDQKLERGNLALKVVNYWADKGISGFTVYKFKLRRLEGQPILTTNQVHFTNGRVPQAISDIRGLVCDDITGGLEDLPIPATNLVDDPPVPPTGFTYMKSIQVAKNVKLPINTAGCNCKGTCVDSRTCACAKLNGSDFPYVHRDGGRLIEARDVVFECGPSCGCGPGCVNRTSQRGLRHRLEVFRTPKKGWAVRSWDFIRSGSPVCEYVGVLKKTEDVDTLTGNDYIFDIDCIQTMRGLEGRKRRGRDVSLPIGEEGTSALDESKTDNGPEFCIDAGPSGNVARFINHSCSPNLFVQCVLSSHQDVRLARVVLFAADNIPPLQELTYDYGYVLDSVMGADGKIKRLACYCGGADCRKRLY
ncbi:Histone-lysine N-methyltransferase, H3 lysine-9 specific SUVH4, partial [Linum grandiflorum]